MSSATADGRILQGLNRAFIYMGMNLGSFKPGSNCAHTSLYKRMQSCILRLIYGNHRSQECQESWRDCGEVLNMLPMHIVLLVSNITFSCLGLFFNALIAVVSCRTALKKPPDLLLLFMGLSSVLFGGFHFFANMASYVWTDAFMTFNICISCVNVVYVLTMFSSTCLTSFLCTFYCIKLVTFQHCLLSRFRSIFPSLLPWILAGTFVISGALLVALTSVISITAPLEDNGISILCPAINQTYRDKMDAMLLGLNYLLVLPFLLIVVSLGATLASLLLYIFRLQNSSLFDKSHLTAHSQAAKTMVLLLLLNVLFYISNVLLYWGLVANSPSLHTLWIIIYFSFWPLQALTLILRTKKFSFTVSTLKICLKK